eukprot:COSAG01_NODE_25347_length_748_cov_0.725732_1_plen_65_part_10
MLSSLFTSVLWANLYQHELDNGLAIYVYEKHSSAKVSVQLAYLVGAYVEGPGEKGMAHLFEHMMF